MIEKIKSVFSIFSKLYYILGEKQRRRSLWVFFTMLVCSGLELLGVSMMAPFLDAILNTSELRNKWYAKIILGLNDSISDEGIILAICIAFILVYVLKNGIMMYGAYIQSSFAASFQRENFVRMLKSYMSRPYQFFLDTNSGLIVRYVENDVHAVYQILIAGFVMVAESISAVLIGIFLIFTDWVIAIAALLLAVCCFLFILIFFKSRMKEAGKENWTANALQHKYSLQAINGIKEINVLDRKKEFLNEYDKVSRRYEKANKTYEFLNACPDRILEGVCISGFMLIVCIRVIAGGDVTAFIPVLGTFAMGAFKILPSVSKISSRVNTIVYYIPGLNNCYNNFKEVEEVDNNISNIEEESNTDSSQAEHFDSQLVIDNITWRYDKANKNVLQDLSLTINKGEAIAFIGPSGSGKTTLADIILGLFRPQKGTIRMDGKDIYDIKKKWAHIIGYVPQSVYLIDDNIKKNIAFGLADEVIDEAKVWKALEQAQLKEYIESLPDGLDTIVGERGIKLSGGQRQRIAIARALYEDPDILVLDEATSALDNETETAVMESIDALQGTKTLIIVAHRLSTVKNCDKIYEINGGKAILRDKDDVLADV